VVKPKCNLIIDSCCDLPFEIVNREGIELVEFSFILEDGEHIDNLYQSLSGQEFFEAMRQGAEPKTAQLTMQRIHDAFMAGVKSKIPTVYLAFSSGLSGAFETALMVHTQIMKEHPDAELYVVDTKLASLAEGLLVYEAIRQRDKGLSAAELAEWAAEAGNYINCQFMVDDLESLRRGGRIPASVAYAGSKLDVKPLLSIDLEGKLFLVGVARGRKKGIKHLASFYEKRVVKNEPGQCVMVGHSDCPKDMERLREEVMKIDKDILLIDSYIGPVVGSHVGPDMLAVVFWGPDRREDLSVADKIARKVKGEH